MGNRGHIFTRLDCILKYFENIAVGEIHQWTVCRIVVVKSQPGLLKKVTESLALCICATTKPEDVGYNQVEVLYHSSMRHNTYRRRSERLCGGKC